LRIMPTSELCLNVTIEVVNKGALACDDALLFIECSFLCFHHSLELLDLFPGELLCLQLPNPHTLLVHHGLQLRRARAGVSGLWPRLLRPQGLNLIALLLYQSLQLRNATLLF